MASLWTSKLNVCEQHLAGQDWHELAKHHRAATCSFGQISVYVITLSLHLLGAEQIPIFWDHKLHFHWPIFTKILPLVI